MQQRDQTGLCRHDDFRHIAKRTLDEPSTPEFGSEMPHSSLNEEGLAPMTRTAPQVEFRWRPDLAAFSQTGERVGERAFTLENSADSYELRCVSIPTGGVQRGECFHLSD